MKTSIQVEDNGRMFTVSFDTEHMRQRIQELVEEGEEFNGWQPIGGDESSRSTLEEIQADIQSGMDFLNQLENNPAEVLLPLIQNFPRKKDGWLPKGRVQLPVEMEHIAYLSQDEYGWRYYAIRAQSINAIEIELSFGMEITKW
jgi:hypothetical protein